MKNKKIVINYDDVTKITTATLYMNGIGYVAYAKCHEEDWDMASELTGSHIATERALILYDMYVKNNCLAPGLKALEDLYSNMKNSKGFNEDSFEARRIRREIYKARLRVGVKREEIAKRKATLKSYMDKKNDFYKKVRNNREKLVETLSPKFYLEHEDGSILTSEDQIIYFTTENRAKKFLKHATKKLTFPNIKIKKSIAFFNGEGTIENPKFKDFK